MEFSTRALRVLFITIAVIFVLMIVSASNNTLTFFAQSILGEGTTPVKQGIFVASEFLEDTFDFSSPTEQELQAEIEKLQEEVLALRLAQIDFNRYATENEQYEEYLNLVQENPEIEYTSAFVVGRDYLDTFYSFTIDKGESDGVSLNDTVITAQGVVGVVQELGENYSKVTTILNPNLQIGAYASTSRDVGIISGDLNLLNSDECVLNYLPKDTLLEEGDIIATSGIGDIFPRDLIIGVVDSIEIDSSGNSKYAVVKTAVNIQSVDFVFVVTDFTN